MKEIKKENNIRYCKNGKCNKGENETRNIINIFGKGKYQIFFCSDECRRIYKNIFLYCQNPNCTKGKDGKSKKLEKSQKIFCNSGCQSHILNFGRKFTEEHRKNISLSKKGKTAWNKGLTKETDERVVKYSHSRSEIVKMKYASGEIIIWNKNKKYKQTEEAKLNIRNGIIEKNKKLIEEFGYVHSPEVRNRIKINNVGKEHNLEIKGKTFEEYYGKEKANELKLNLSIKNKGNINNIKGKTFEEYYGNEKTKIIKYNISKSLKEYFKNNNQIKYIRSGMEIEFGRKICEIFGIKLKHSFKIESKCYDYKIVGRNILIECDGTYWHSLPQNIENDKFKNILAEENGYKLYRFNLGRKRDVDKFIKENYNKLRKIFI